MARAGKGKGFSKSKPMAIKGEDALVEEIRTRGKKHPLEGFIRRTSHRWKMPKPEYNLAHALAYIFFPENFARPVAVSTGVKGEAMRKTYFEKVELDRESQEAIEAYYSRGELSPKFLEHERRVFERARLLRFEEAGITPNKHAMNIGFRGNRPVFFEIAYVDIIKAEKYARKKLTGMQKKQALGIIGGLKKYVPKEEWHNVRAHV